MFKTIAMTTLVLFAVSSTAHAGSDTLKNASGDKMKLWCKNSGCYTKVKKKGEKWTKQERIGPGGRPNFLKHQARFQSNGWS